MSVQNGNPANANTFNTSFVSREEDSDTVGVLGLNNTTDVNSGDQIINAQRLINEVADSDGTDGEGDATRKIYGSENVVADGDSRKSAIGKLDERFNGTTGHSHDGTDGNGPAISAASISDFNNFFAEYQELTFDSANGLTTDVSADFAAKTPGGTSSSVGVLTTAPGNRVEIVGKDDYREIEDASGNRVYARLEESTSWTLTYYVNIAGVETAHNLSSQNIRYLYREVFTAATRPTISPSVGLYDSLSAVEDIPAASTTVEGKVTTGAQSFGGVKNFIDGLQKNGVDAVTISDAQTIINKILNGGVATDTRYWNVPAETTANLTALTRKAGAIYYSTDELTYYGDDGVTLIGLGGGSGGGGLDSSFQENFEETEASDFISGNSAVFAASGSLAGTLADEEASPLAGARSIKYTQAAGSLDDWFYPIDYTVARKDKGQFLSVTIYNSYDGGSSDLELTVWDTANAKSLESFFIVSSDIKRYSAVFFCPSNATTLKIGHHVKVENIGAVLEFDNIEVSANPFSTFNISETTEWQPYTPAISQGLGTLASVELYWRQNGENVEVTGSFNCGTTSAVEIQLGLPNAYTVSNSKVDSIKLADGIIARVINDINSVEHFPLATPGDAYINMSFASTGPLTPQLGSSLFGSGNKVSLFFSVAVNELSNTQGVIAKNSSANNSMIRVRIGNGYGTTNTRIARWSTIEEQEGSSIELVQSSADGDSFIVKEDGNYSMSLALYSTGATFFGTTVNSTELSTGFSSLTDYSKSRISTFNSAGAFETGSWQGNLKAGDVIRVHTDGASYTGPQNQFTVAKIGTTQVTGVPLPKRTYLSERQPQNTAGGTFTAGSWVTRTLNSTSNNFINLNANQAELQPGTWNVFFTMPARQVLSHQARLFNVTAAAVMADENGNELYSNSGYEGVGNTNTMVTIQGQFKITETTIVRIEHRCSSTKTINGFGIPANLGPEVYTNGYFERLN